MAVLCHSCQVVMLGEAVGPTARTEAIARCSRLHRWHPGAVRVHSTDAADLGELREACEVCSWAHVLVDAGGCPASRSSACHFVRSGGLNTTAAEPSRQDTMCLLGTHRCPAVQFSLQIELPLLSTGASPGHCLLPVKLEVRMLTSSLRDVIRCAPQLATGVVVSLPVQDLIDASLRKLCQCQQSCLQTMADGIPIRLHLHSALRQCCFQAAVGFVKTSPKMHVIISSLGLGKHRDCVGDCNETASQRKLKAACHAAMGTCFL